MPDFIIVQEQSQPEIIEVENSNPEFIIEIQGGSSPDVVEILTQQQGPPGGQGESAYDIWLSLNNEGSESDFIASLKGEPGQPAEQPSKNPVFTYSSGKLISVSYGDGSQKVLSYSGSNLSQVDHIKENQTIRKTFSYEAGFLASIQETILN